MTCDARHQDKRCHRDAGHPLPHRDGLTTWAFDDPTVPEWIKRQRQGELRAKELRDD